MQSCVYRMSILRSAATELIPSVAEALRMTDR